MARSRREQISIFFLALVFASVSGGELGAQQPACGPKLLKIAAEHPEMPIAATDERSPDDVATPLSSEWFSGFFTELLVPDSRLMSECYGAVFRGGYFSGRWFSSGIGYEVILGIEGAKGKPARRNPAWTISSSELGLVNGFVGAMFMYSFYGNPGRRNFDPFGGLGVQCDAGGERIVASGFRSIGSEVLGFEGHDWSIRTSFSIKLLLASKMRISERCKGITGVQWTHGGMGSDKSLKFEEDAEAFYLSLYDAVKRSDYNFTGWSLIFAIEW